MGHKHSSLLMLMRFIPNPFVFALQNYLEDDEFEEVFEMNREQFAQLPGWKKEAMKKDKKLF